MPKTGNMNKLAASVTSLESAINKLQVSIKSLSANSIKNEADSIKKMSESISDIDTSSLSDSLRYITQIAKLSKQVDFGSFAIGNATISRNTTSASSFKGAMNYTDAKATNEQIQANVKHTEAQAELMLSEAKENLTDAERQLAESKVLYARAEKDLSAAMYTSEASKNKASLDQATIAKNISWAKKNAAQESLYKERLASERLRSDRQFENTAYGGFASYINKRGFFMSRRPGVEGLFANIGRQTAGDKLAHAMPDATKSVFDKATGLLTKPGINVGGFVGGAIGVILSKIPDLAKALLKLSDAAMVSYGNIDKLRIQMGVVFGSSAESESYFDEIKNYAIKSPFSVETTTSMATLLKQSGVFNSDLIKVMKQIGDISMGNEDKYKRIAQNYAQIMANERATARDIREFATAGIPIYDILSKVLDEPVSAVRKSISDGKVTSEVIAESFDRLTSEGGAFHNATELGAQTYTARKTNLEDIKELAKAEFGEAVYDLYGNKLLTIEEKLFKGVMEFFAKRNENRDAEEIKNKIDNANVVLKGIYLSGKHGKSSEQVVVQEMEPKLTSLIENIDNELVRETLFDLYTNGGTIADDIIAYYNSKTPEKQEMDEDLFNHYADMYRATFSSLQIWTDTKWDPYLPEINGRSGVRYGLLQSKSFNEEAKLLGLSREDLREIMKNYKPAGGEADLYLDLEPLERFSKSITNLAKASNTLAESFQKAANSSNSLTSLTSKYDSMYYETTEGKKEKYQEERKEFDEYTKRFDFVDQFMIGDEINMKKVSSQDYKRLLQEGVISDIETFDVDAMLKDKIFGEETDRYVESIRMQFDVFMRNLTNVIGNVIEESDGNYWAKELKYATEMYKKHISSGKSIQSFIKSEGNTIAWMMDNARKTISDQDVVSLLLSSQNVKSSTAKRSKLRYLDGDLEPLWKRLFSSVSQIPTSSFSTKENAWTYMLNEQANQLTQSLIQALLLNVDSTDDLIDSIVDSIDDFGNIYTNYIATSENLINKIGDIDRTSGPGYFSFNSMTNTIASSLNEQTEVYKKLAAAAMAGTEEFANTSNEMALRYPGIVKEFTEKMTKYSLPGNIDKDTLVGSGGGKLERVSMIDGTYIGDETGIEYGLDQVYQILNSGRISVSIDSVTGAKIANAVSLQNMGTGLVYTENAKLGNVLSEEVTAESPDNKTILQAIDEEVKANEATRELINAIQNLTKTIYDMNATADSTAFKYSVEDYVYSNVRNRDGSIGIDRSSKYTFDYDEAYASSLIDNYMAVYNSLVDIYKTSNGNIDVGVAKYKEELNIGSDEYDKALSGIFKKISDGSLVIDDLISSFSALNIPVEALVAGLDNTRNRSFEQRYNELFRQTFNPDLDYGQPDTRGDSNLISFWRGFNPSPDTYEQKLARAERFGFSSLSEREAFKNRFVDTMDSNDVTNRYIGSLIDKNRRQYKRNIEKSKNEALDDADRRYYRDAAADALAKESSLSAIRHIKNMSSSYDGNGNLTDKAKEQIVDEAKTAGLIDSTLEFSDAWKEVSENIMAAAENELILQDQFRSLGESFKDLGKDFISSGIESSMRSLGKAVVAGEDASEAFGNAWKEAGRQLLNAMPQLLINAGLNIMGTVGNWKGIGIGMALIAAGGGMSLLNGMMDAAEEAGDNDELKRLEALKDGLQDLMEQARADALYYEKEMRHRKALSVIDNVTNVNDAIITPSGKVVSTHPDDYLIATKTPGSLVGASANSAPVVNINVQNMSGEPLAIQQSTTYNNGNVDIVAVIKQTTAAYIAGEEGDEAFNARSVRLAGSSSVR